MYQCNGRFIIRIMEIRIEVTKLSHQEHSFIYDGPAAQRIHVREIIGLLKYSSYNVKTTVKIHTSRHIKRTFHKALLI